MAGLWEGGVKGGPTLDNLLARLVCRGMEDGTFDEYG